MKKKGLYDWKLLVWKKKLEDEEGWAKTELVGLPKHSLMGIYRIFHLKFNDSAMQKIILK